MSRYPRTVRACWLGSVPYREAWDLQLALVDAIRHAGAADTLLLLEHPHVFTMGRHSDAGHVLWDGTLRRQRAVDLVSSDRGGDVTYHGPGQLVGYPLLDLARLGTDLLTYLRRLERTLISYLAGLGLESEPGGRGLTGVWSGGEKVAAIGVKMSDTVVSHGFALNLAPDLDYFAGIVPCGLPDKRATSVLRLLGAAPATADAAFEYARHFASEFGFLVEWIDGAELEIAVSRGHAPDPYL